MQWHNYKASPFDLQPLESILNLEDSLHSLQHLKTEVRNFAFFCDLNTATTKYLRLWRPASAFKIHSKGFKSNGEDLWLCYRLFFLSTYWFSDIFIPFKKTFWDGTPCTSKASVGRYSFIIQVGRGVFTTGLL